MKQIYLEQIEVIPGNVKTNFEICKKQIENVVKNNTLNDSIIVAFPELCLSGYLIGDLWEDTEFLKDCEFYGKELAKLSTKKLTIIFGNVYIDWHCHGNDGRPLKGNAAFVANNGNFVFNKVGLPYLKTLLPNYREFDEDRYFQNSKNIYDMYCYNFKNNFSHYTVNKFNFGITVCEDGWDDTYSISPIKLIDNKVDAIFNLSSSPFTIDKNKARDKKFSKHAELKKVPVFYVNCVGLQNNGKTIFTFDGSSIAYNCLGVPMGQLPYFKSGELRISYYEDIGDIVLTNNYVEEKSSIEQLYVAVIYGITQYCKYSHINKVVIGNSGGIDSAVEAALFSIALNPENVYLINMPSKFNSETTKNAAYELAINLKANYMNIPISNIYDSIVNSTNGRQFYIDGIPLGKIAYSGLNLENIQARTRNSILTAVASSFKNAGFTCNGNKTELTVGYCTIYGDLSGFMAPIADLWKHEVYELGKYINEKILINAIPESIFTVKPSAELSSNQNVDEGKGDPIIYWYHDYLFKYWEESWNKSPLSKVLFNYRYGTLCQLLKIPNKSEIDIKNIFKTDKDFVNDLENWYNKYRLSVFKRVQSPPVLALSRRAYGFDYREALNIDFYSNEYLKQKKTLFKK